MKTNNQTNNLIKWAVVLFDFLILFGILLLFTLYHPAMSQWRTDRVEIFWVVSFSSLMACEFRLPTIIHQRLVSAGDVLKRVVQTTTFFAVLAYLLMKVVDLRLPVGWLLIQIGTALFILITIFRFIERALIKQYRQMGRNTRAVVFVGSDPEIWRVRQKLLNDPTTGYRLFGYYGEPVQTDTPWLGSLQYLINHLNTPQQLRLADDMYVCLSRRQGDTVKLLSTFCDKNLIHFYYVPVSLETLDITLKPELLDDIEVYSTCENPMASPVNKLVKRVFDIIFSLIFLILTLPFYPLIALIIKLQSPGPIFFRQMRTGLDGHHFLMYKFRSMHVNPDADRLQATEHDPRKFPFGNFMRRMNIDELPQFINVIKGDMSIVGPRPHMLAHTEMYAALIDKFMVRHFVKPGITGWAQVSGFRGETKDIEQMENRVKADIWYIEHWDIFLDLRIILRTIKSLVIHDANAY